MISSHTSFIFLKIGKKKYVEPIGDGIISFGCAAKYVRDFRLYNNSEQGDEYEAVFARLKKGNVNIGTFQQLLGSDLEIIDDNEYVKLRRRSSLHAPIFCLYAIQARDVQQYAEPKEGQQNVKYDDYCKMQKGFADLINKNVMETGSLYCEGIMYPREFAIRFFHYCFKNNVPSCIKKIDYVTKASDEYIIPPNADRMELFFKDKAYSYQNEYRLVLPTLSLSSVDERYIIDIGGIDSFHSVSGTPTEMVFTCTFAKNNT